MSCRASLLIGIALVGGERKEESQTCGFMPANRARIQILTVVLTLSHLLTSSNYPNTTRLRETKKQRKLEGSSGWERESLDIGNV